MKSLQKAFFFTLILVSLTSCGSNTSPPALEDLQLDRGSVPAGQNMKIFATFRVGTSESGVKDQSDPFAAVIVLPQGATFATGTSNIVPSIPRSPNKTGACSGGRTYLLYSFGPGEFPDEFHFNDFAAVVEFEATLQLAADKSEVAATVLDTPPADPCGVVADSTAKLRVRAAVPTPTATPSK